MKVVSTEGLTKLIQLVKSAFVKVEDVVETSEVTLADVAISGDYDDLINKPTIGNATLTITQGGVSKGTFTANASSDVTIALDSGGGSSYTAGTGIDITNNEISVDNTIALKSEIPTATSDLTNDSGYITSSALTPYVLSADLATVATSGSYNDLSDKPSAVTESTVSGWGFTKNTGTVTSVNNVSPVNGNVTLSIPTVPTNVSAFTNDSGYITSSYHDLTKQDTLVSGTNIKTVNNQSLLGSGNIDIQGGDSYSAGDWIDISNDTISAKGDVNTDLIGETLYGWNFAGAGAEILDRNLIYTKSMSTGVYLKIYDNSGNEITQIGVIEGIEEDYTYYTVTGLYINNEWQAELYLEGLQDSLLFFRSTDVSRSLDEVLPTQKAVKTYVDNKDSLVVHKTGTETISGTKTFSSSPIVPTVTTSDSSTKAASTAFVKNVLASIYPVGSIYIGTQSTCPMATLISGSTWKLVAANKALWTGNGTNANTTIAAGLPNITGAFDIINHNPNNHAYTGAFTKATAGGYPISGVAGGVNWSEGWGYIQENFDASYSNSIYGSSSTVQPPAYVVNVWRRTA